MKHVNGAAEENLSSVYLQYCPFFFLLRKLVLGVHFFFVKYKYYYNISKPVKKFEYIYDLMLK